MIIWRGWGILAALIAAACAGIGGFLVESLTDEPDVGALGAAAGLAMSAIPVFLVGRHLNRPIPGFDPRTGQPTYFVNRHTLFFVPMQYWGFLLLGLSAIIVVAALL